MIGQVLGHYRIDSKLGEGGMGVVYRAFDTHLDRPVAIKVLRADATASPERKRRFVQEAKSASALNHPNIIHIYDINTANLSDGPIDFIAMEFVPGRTLDQCIGRNGLPLKDTLRYSIQIADALARAHSAGIVHRDLKPANIIVADDGRVKLLDFGLAKLTEKTDDDPGGVTATMTAQEKPQTEEGAIVGTVAYMSPEQAEGKKVDARSDIFSFGSVLYEMVTGHRPFEGATKISTLSAILHKEPKSAGEIAPNIPAELEKIISRCLRKDAGRRTQHMDDVKLALEDLKEESESGKLPAHTRPVASPSRAGRLLAEIGAGILILALASALAWRFAHSGSPRPFNPVLTRLTNDSGLTTDPALSPDGKLVAYASDRGGKGNLDLWVQQINGGQAIQLTHDAADDHEASFSPDGSQIAFRSEREGGGIYIVSILGGEERLVARQGRRPRFSPDGSQIAFWVGNIGGDPSVPGTSKIYVASSAGGAPRQLHREFAGARYPVWSADGKRILFWGIRDSTSREQTEDWWVTDVTGGEAIPSGAVPALRRAGLQVPLGAYMIIPAEWAALSNKVLFSAESGDSTNLWEIPVAVDGRVAGPPERLTSGSGLEMQPAATGAGLFVFSSMQDRIDVWKLPLDANRAAVTGGMERLTDDGAPHLHPVISANERSVVYVSKKSGAWGLWAKDLPSGKVVSLAAIPSPIAWPALSADGSQAAYAVGDNDGYRPSINSGRPKRTIFVVPTTGGEPQTVCDGCDAAYSFSQNGKEILFWPAGSRGIGLLDLVSGRRAEILNRPGYAIYRTHFSPDDHWIAFHARNRPDRSAIFVVPFAGMNPIPEGDWIAVTGGESYDTIATWSPDGNTLYFVSERDGFRCIWAQRLDAATKHPAGSPLPVQHFHSAARSMIHLTTNWLSLSVARGMLVFNVGDLTGNIWLVRPAQ